MVAHEFAIGDWAPDVVERFRDVNGLRRTILLWRIRERAE